MAGKTSIISSCLYGRPAYLADMTFFDSYKTTIMRYGIQVYILLIILIKVIVKFIEIPYEDSP